MIDTIIILGDLLRPDGSMSDSLISRLDRGIKIFEKMNKPPVIMSGYRGFMAPYEPPITEAKAMKEYAIKHGIPADKILLEEESKDTIGNAFFTKVKYLKPKNWKNIIVIASDFNIERAKYTFDSILGSEYSIKYVGAITNIPETEKSRLITIEKKIMESAFFKQCVDKIDPKDDEKTKQLLYSEHPAYAKNPKITTEDIIRMLKGV